jgi:TonB family protein
MAATRQLKSGKVGLPSVFIALACCWLIGSVSAMADPKISPGNGSQTDNSAWSPYFADLQRRIKKHWFPPKGQASQQVKVQFHLGKDGVLSNTRILKSSGQQVVDGAALRAVENSAPFRPLPDFAAGTGVDFSFTFDDAVFNGGLGLAICSGMSGGSRPDGTLRSTPIAPSRPTAAKARDFESWHNAAVHGDLDAQTLVGITYFNGPPKDGYLAYLWTSYAAEHGSHSAVGDRPILETYLTPSQIKEARAILKKWDPSKPIPPRPSFTFAVNDVITNPPVDRLRAAAEQGNPLAQMQLSREYSIIGRLGRDEKESMKWLRKAADAGNPDALRTLANMDPSASKALLQKANIQEQSDARSYLAGLTFTPMGNETPSDPSEAVKYWTQQAEQKYDKRALFNLGLAYHKGFGVAADDVMANMWLTLAVACFDWKVSLETRSQLRTLLTTEQIDEGVRMAKEWMTKHPLPEQSK